MALRYVRFFQYRGQQQKSIHQSKSVWKEVTRTVDVTLLVNGLPLVQIELKRSGIEIKTFNQINRYQNHSFWSNHGLFQYVQLFVISNGSILNIWPTTNCNRSNKPSFGQMPIIKTH
jgi:type I restriction enzyme R subunit